MQNDQSVCRKYFDLTDFAQLTFRSQKMAYKGKKKLMPPWIFQKVLMRIKFLIWNGLMHITGLTDFSFTKCNNIYKQK